MTWNELEQIFNRSLQYTFSKKKLLFVLPVLIACGLLIVFCRALAVDAGKWIILSLTFLPVFLTSGILLSLGVVLARVYHNEVKHLHVSYRRILSQSWELLIGVSYITVPFILGYLMLWALTGVFYLLKEIPAVGDTIGVILSFGPFLLVLGSLTLSVITLFTLFFVTPQVALKSGVKLKLADDLYRRFNDHIFSNLALFFIALLPLISVVGLLSLAASMTGASFTIPRESLSIAMQWFFIMIPFAALLSPSVIFFFNFSVEIYVIIHQKMTETKPEPTNESRHHRSRV